MYLHINADTNNSKGNANSSKGLFCRVCLQENRTVVLRGGDWQSVTHSLESEERNLDNLHTMAFTLKDLEIATDYVAVVRVRNKYGWSAESPNFNFSTKKGKCKCFLAFLLCPEVYGLCVSLFLFFCFLCVWRGAFVCVCVFIYIYIHVYV